MKKIVAITGIYGHVGTALTIELLKHGYEVRGLALPFEKPSPALKAIEGQYKIFLGDVNKIETMDDFLNHNGDEELFVVHSAGIISIFKKDERLFETNVNGTKKVFELAISKNAKRFIYLSSCDAIDVLKKPQVMCEQTYYHEEKMKGDYAICKCLAGNYILDNKDRLDSIIIHPTAIIGPYDTGKNLIIHLIKNYLRRGWSLGATGGFDFVDVRDVAIGIRLAIEKGIPGSSYILGNRYTKIPKLLKLERKIGHLRFPAFNIPVTIAKIFAPFFEFYYKRRKKSPLFTPYALMTISHNANYSHEKATAELGYEPRLLEDTMKDMLDYLRSLK